MSSVRRARVENFATNNEEGATKWSLLLLLPLNFVWPVATGPSAPVSVSSSQLQPLVVPQLEQT